MSHSGVVDYGSDGSCDLAAPEVAWPEVVAALGLGDIQVDELLALGAELAGVSAREARPGDRSSGKRAVERVERQRQVLAILQIYNALGAGQGTAVTVAGVQPVVIHSSCGEDRAEGVG